MKMSGLMRLGGEIQTRNQTSCPSNMLSSLYNSFPSSLSLLLGPLQTMLLTLWHRLSSAFSYSEVGSQSGNGSCFFSSIFGLEMTAFLTLTSWQKEGKKEEKQGLHVSIFNLLRSSGKNGEGNRKPQPKGSF